MKAMFIFISTIFVSLSFGQFTTAQATLPADFIPPCPLDIFNKSNPNILDQNITDQFIILTKSCIGLARGNLTLPAECYTCEEFVCSISCIFQTVGYVSFIFSNSNHLLKTITLIQEDSCGNIADANLKDYTKNKYVILDWAKAYSDDIVDGCLESSIDLSLLDAKAGRFPCDSQLYYFAICFYLKIDELYKSRI